MPSTALRSVLKTRLKTGRYVAHGSALSHLQHCGNTSRDDGNALLEFVFYLPIIVLFLVASTDIGLQWSEASAVSSALRSGKREAQLVLHQQKNSTGLEDVSVSQIVNQVYQHLVGRVAAYKANGIGNVNDDFSVLVQLWQSDGQSSTLRLVAEEGDSSLSQFNANNEFASESSTLPKIVLSEDRGFSTELSTKARYLYARVKSRSPSLAREFIIESIGAEASVDDEITFAIEADG